ncbi:hypothetical protein R6Z07F_016298 [Ovis aries]
MQMSPTGGQLPALPARLRAPRPAGGRETRASEPASERPLPDPVKPGPRRRPRLRHSGERARAGPWPRGAASADRPNREPLCCRRRRHSGAQAPPPWKRCIDSCLTPGP